MRVCNDESKSQRTQVHKIVPMNECKGALRLTRRIPRTVKAPVTQRMLPPREVPALLQREFDRKVKGWDDCVTKEMNERLENAVCNVMSAYRDAQRSTRTDAVIAAIHRNRSLERFAPLEYTVIAQKVMAEGFQIHHSTK